VSTINRVEFDDSITTRNTISPDIYTSGRVPLSYDYNLTDFQSEYKIFNEIEDDYDNSISAVDNNGCIFIQHEENYHYIIWADDHNDFIFRDGPNVFWHARKTYGHDHLHIMKGKIIKIRLIELLLKSQSSVNIGRRLGIDDFIYPFDRLFIQSNYSDDLVIALLIQYTRVSLPLEVKAIRAFYRTNYYKEIVDFRNKILNGKICSYCDDVIINILCRENVDLKQVSEFYKCDKISLLARVV